MEISFVSAKLQKTLSDGKLMIKAYGKNCASKLQLRLAVLREAKTMSAFTPNRKPERCHELVGNRKGQLSMDLEHPYRLIFTPDHDPAPTSEDGGLDWQKIVAIKITEIVDTH